MQIKGQVSSASNKPPETEFLTSNGNWKLKTSSFNMGKVYMKDEFVVREFGFANGGLKPITYSGKYVGPKYIRVDVAPKTIAPGERGTVKISYNGKQKNQYGFQSDNVEIQTDDELNPSKSFSIINAVNCSPSTLAKTVKTSANPPLVIQHFCPFSK